MAKEFNSKYPTIVMDKRSNSVNESMIKKLTVEEYYDLLHHTHKMSDVISDDDTVSYDEIQTTIEELSQTINSLNDTINEYQNTIQRLEADTTELRNTIATQQETINTLKDEIANTMSNVGDWDVETEGIQNINGETIMGFTMTEL